MKGLLIITSAGFILLSGLCNPRCRADAVYVSTGSLNTILTIDSNGNQSVFANSGMSFSEGLAFDGRGDLFVANAGNNTIEEFNSSGTGSVFATATSGLDYPIGLAFDNSGNLYAANYGNSTIEEFNSNGTGSVFATSGLSNPTGLAFDPSGNLYVANQGDYTIEKFNSNGTGSVFATSASGVDNPYGLAFFGGSLYVANLASSTIEKFNASGIGSTFASYSTNGAGAYLIEPGGITFDSSGNLYVAIGGSGGRILEIDPEGDISVFASGLPNAIYLAIEVPEPSPLLLATLGAFSLVVSLKRPRA